MFSNFVPTAGADYGDEVLSQLPHLRVESIAQAVTEEVQGEESCGYSHAREDQLPRENCDVLNTFCSKASPRCERRLNTDSQEREERVLEHDRRHSQSGVNNHRAN